VRLSESFEGSVELNENTLCVYGLSKGCNTGITEYINLKNSGNNKGHDQKGNICMLSILVQLLLLNYSIYSIVGKFEPNAKTLCACTLSK
jgi:hypothetical protein